MSSAETTYRVAGMTCGGCAGSVQRAVGRVLPGVNITVSHESDTVTVYGPHDAAVLEKAVSEAGFDFQGAHTPGS